MRWLRFPRLLGLIACLYLMAMAVLFGYLSIQNYRFVHDAGRTTGTVIALRRPPAGRRDPERSGRHPRAAGPLRGGRPDVRIHGGPRHVSADLQLGDQVVVLYDPADPSQARLRGEGRLMVPLITSGFATAALLVGYVLFRTRHLGPRQHAQSAAPRPDQVAAGR